MANSGRLIPGAERLIVDAAQELADKGHKVEIWTAFHDPKRSFAETVDGDFDVIVRGGWFPMSILGRAVAVCAYIRCFLFAMALILRARRTGVRPDVVVVDQVSAVIPLLQCLLGVPVLFYCHFPDCLLANPRSTLHRLYRWPIHHLEESTTGMADEIVVNSRFTQGIFAQTFTRLARRNVVPPVLYPAVAVPSEDELRRAAATWRDALPPWLLKAIDGHGPLLLSINRFDRKKNLPLALRAFAAYLTQDSKTGKTSALVFAGGYDPRLPENVEHLQELKALAAELGVAEHVFFLPSFSDEQRGALLAAAAVVLYTPTHEHFGIVPLEAGAARRVVLACSSGGPLESIVPGQTGELCPPDPAAWAAALARLLEVGHERRLAQLGNHARERVLRQFSRAAFGQQVETRLLQLVAQNEAAREGRAAPPEARTQRQRQGRTTRSKAA